MSTNSLTLSRGVVTTTIYRASETETSWIGNHSEPGRRGWNEDCCLCSTSSAPPEARIAISDGMGGAPLGRQVSLVASTRGFSSLNEGSSPIEAFREAEQEVRLFLRDARSTSSGATLLLASIVGRCLRVAWKGDTGCLVVRDSEMQRVTTADRVPGTNLLTRCVSARRDGYPNYRELQLREGDGIVFFTDGIDEDDARIHVAEGIAVGTCARDIACGLVEHAKQSSHDDASAVVAIIQ